MELVAMEREAPCAVSNGWHKIAVSDCSQIKTGPFGTLLKASEYSGSDGVPLISVGEIREGYFRISDETPRVPSEVVHRLPQFVLKEGDIVFGRKGAVERSAMVGPGEAGWFLGSDGIVVRPVVDVCPRFLAFQFQSVQARAWLKANAIGTTMASLNQAILGSLVVQVPDSQFEQQAIAAALTDADGLIDSLQRLIAKKRYIKLGTMQELLTAKRRLPGFEGEWENFTLADIGTFSKGKGIKRNEVANHGVCCIRYGELYTQYNDYIYFPVSRIPRGVADSALLIKTGDILFAGSGETAEEIGRCAAYLGDEMTYAGGDIVVYSPIQQDSMFLAHLLNQPLVARQKACMGQGNAVVHIHASHLARIEICLPPLPEQHAIASILYDMDAEITTLETKLEKARHIKQGMMQQLLTGRIRLV